MLKKRNIHLLCWFFSYCLLFLLLPFFTLPALAQGVGEAWVARYNGPGFDLDGAYALAVDDSGNVYVTGNSFGSGTSRDYATIKYSPSGDTLWVRRYEGPEGTDDYATALAVDDSGNVYVTGYLDFYCDGGCIGGDYATIKYAPNGDTFWVRTYDGPGVELEGNAGDVATALAVDDSGNVYVTGRVGVTCAPACYIGEYATIKYSSSGDTLWVRRYLTPGVNDRDGANALAVDDSGNVYVTGHSTGSGTSKDYATIKYSPAGDTLWVRRYNGPGNDFDVANALAVDGSGNVYVTGQSDGSGTSSDYATIKYSSSGDTLWVRRYNGSGNLDDGAFALAVDDSGNLYVTGWSFGSGTSYDYATIKYSPSGDTLWVKRYNGPPGNSSDGALALAVDGSGNVYVTGRSDGSGINDDYATIKYAPNGDTLWVRRYNGPGNNDDEANALAVDGSGNVYVTGMSIGTIPSDYDYATIKYSPCSSKAGDVNGDGGYNLPDIVGEVNIVFKGAPKPTPNCRADANADNTISLPDIIKLVNKVFKGGPTPPPIGVCCL